MATFGKKWSSAELALLETTEDLNELAALLPGRTLGAIKKKRIDMLSFHKEPWTEDEILQFPTEHLVNKFILAELGVKLSPRSKDQIWKKMKSIGYLWDKDFQEEISDTNPYPDHGKKWTPKELALFPEDKLVNSEVLERVQALFPRRKPSSIWPKMKKEGYIWEVEEKPELAVTNDAEVTLSPEGEFVLSLAHELGFRQPQAKTITLEPALNNITSYRGEIAKKLDLPEDFGQGELYYAIGTRISPFPWDLACTKEIALAYRTKDKADIMAAAKALHKALEYFING